MGRYFSFQKLISIWFVQVAYFVGFLLISAAGIALTVWASLQLRDATISRTLGWQYVAEGVGLLVVGNLLWRVLCELWIVLFNIHDELVTMRSTIGSRDRAPVPVTLEADEHVEDDIDAVDMPPSHAIADERHHTASVLGLS